MQHGREADEALRQEAVRRVILGEPIAAIARDLERSRQWVYTWWNRYVRHGAAGLAEQSRAPKTRPNTTPAETEQAIVRLRRELEAGATPETRYGFIGRRAIRRRLGQAHVAAIPSLATIQRTLARHGLTKRAESDADSADYPKVAVGAAHCLHATDIISRYLRGGLLVQNFHSIDVFTRAIHMTQATEKTSATAVAHLLESYAQLGLPCLQQLDNEDCFSGGHTHERVLGRVVRTCLFVGVEPLFLPFYEPKRNGHVERFHGVWVQGFWSRHDFASLEEVQREVPLFYTTYMTTHTPASLGEKTPEQMQRHTRPRRLSAPLRALIPEALPVTAGRVHFIRKVDAQGTVGVLNRRWPVGKRWAGAYIWARIDTARQSITFVHRADEAAACKQIKVLRFSIASPVVPLLPQFLRARPSYPEG